MLTSMKMEFCTGGAFRSFVIFLLLMYVFFLYFWNRYPKCPVIPHEFFSPVLEKPPFFNPPPPDLAAFKRLASADDPLTNVNHLLFGLVGSEKAWHHRHAYIQSWWRPNATRGFLFLDRAPTGSLLPWSPASPPYRVSDDLTKFLNKTDVTPQRIIHAIMEAFRETNQGFRWLVMGDDDSVFFLENMIEILRRYDHTKYYYLGGHSEFIWSNYWYSFSQGFGGAGFIMSYPLAKVVAEGMEACLDRYRDLDAADLTTMSCIADFGVSLTAIDGIHQVDLRGDLSGFLSAHPKAPLISLHHFDMVDPIFPSKDRAASTRHLMQAAAVDHSRMLQQTVCYHRPTNWSFSISWGYSAHIYERIMPRSYLQCPIETFKQWNRKVRVPPYYMFNTRLPSRDPCETPHVFYYETIDKTPGNDQILTRFNRARSRRMPSCPISGNHSADKISRIEVSSPAAKRFQIDRSECCDIVRIAKGVARVKIRECATD